MGNALMALPPLSAPPRGMWVPRCYLTNFLEGFSGPTDPVVTVKIQVLHGSSDFKLDPSINPPS